MIDFGSRVMECPGEAEPSQWLWQVLLAPVSNPPPVAWGRGYPQGVRSKRPGQSYSTWNCLSLYAIGAPVTLGDFTES